VLAVKVLVKQQELQRSRHTHWCSYYGKTSTKYLYCISRLVQINADLSYLKLFFLLSVHCLYFGKLAHFLYLLLLTVMVII